MLFCSVKMMYVQRNAVGDADETPDARNIQLKETNDSTKHFHK